MDKKQVYIISDSLGETAEMVTRAAAEQFRDSCYIINKFPFVNAIDQVEEVIAQCVQTKGLLIFTTVIKEIKDEIIKRAREENLLYIDIMTPLLNEFKLFFNSTPKCEPGIIHKLDEEYFSKIEAVEFAVKYDDGKDPRGVKRADVVLLGISRTSKTPLSMYLAHKNLKVANIPLVPEVPVPKEIFEIDKNKIIGLTTDPSKLNAIREERLKTLGLDSDTAIYAKLDRILTELDYADKFYRKIGCPVIDVSNKAVEETANLIIDIIKRRAF
jgi:regulator of PEP synthase PpsR (kinase-PPPase family)